MVMPASSKSSPVASAVNTPRHRKAASALTLPSPGGASAGAGAGGGTAPPSAVDGWVMLDDATGKVCDFLAADDDAEAAGMFGVLAERLARNVAAMEAYVGHLDAAVGAAERRASPRRSRATAADTRNDSALPEVCIDVDGGVDPDAGVDGDAGDAATERRNPRPHAVAFLAALRRVLQRRSGRGGASVATAPESRLAARSPSPAMTAPASPAASKLRPGSSFVALRSAAAHIVV